MVNTFYVLCFANDKDAKIYPEIWMQKKCFIAIKLVD